MSQKTDDWPAHAFFHVEISLKWETKKKRRRKKRLWLVQSSLARPRGLPDWRYLCKLSRRDEESSERASGGRMRMSLRMRLQGKRRMLLIGRYRLRSIVDQCLIRCRWSDGLSAWKVEASKLIAQSSGNLSSHGRSSSLEGWRLCILNSLARPKEA